MTTIRTLALAALASVTLAGTASAIELNTDNVDRANVQISRFAVGATVIEGRSSAMPTRIELNTRNADRDAAALLLDVQAPRTALEGRASAAPSIAFLNDDNLDRAQAYGR